MLSRQAACSSRIPILRPRRPPSTITHEALSRPRLFTQNSKLQVITRQTPRPQLPYLSQPRTIRRLSPLDQTALRLLSTESRQYWKEQSWLAARWTLILWTFAALGFVSYIGIRMEQDERESPTPSEWPFWPRQDLRSARSWKKGESSYGAVDWGRVASSYMRALIRLEKKTPDIHEQADGEGIDIRSVGKAGKDVSSKSWEWRAGYYEVLMGCAESAEHQEGMVTDVTRRVNFPKEVVIGPSNPDPRPPARYMGEAPLEENCEPAFDPPERFYMQVLTTKGFTTKQRLDAANKYAHYLERKGLNESAEEMYRWGLDIAKAALPNATDAIDNTSLVVKGQGESIVASTNMLHAVTNLAAHRARTGDVASALPIFLSVFRARRTAPIDPYAGVHYGSSSNQGSSSSTDIGGAMNFLSSIFRGTRFPAEPPSGDDAFARAGDAMDCDDSELMLYIGEILFATSPSVEEGLGWTKQAVSVAEEALKGKLEKDEEKKCKECLLTGANNWEAMLQQVLARDIGIIDREGGRSAGWLEWGGWFGGRSGKGKVLDDAHRGMLAAELEKVQALKAEIARKRFDEEIYKYRGAGSGVWIG